MKIKTENRNKTWQQIKKVMKGTAQEEIECYAGKMTKEFWVPMDMKRKWKKRGNVKIRHKKIII